MELENGTRCISDEALGEAMQTIEAMTRNSEKSPAFLANLQQIEVSVDTLVACPRDRQSVVGLTAQAFSHILKNKKVRGKSRRMRRTQQVERQDR